MSSYGGSRYSIYRHIWKKQVSSEAKQGLVCACFSSAHMEGAGKHRGKRDLVIARHALVHSFMYSGLVSTTTCFGSARFSFCSLTLPNADRTPNKLTSRNIINFYSKLNVVYRQAKCSADTVPSADRPLGHLATSQCFTRQVYAVKHILCLM